MLMKKTTTFILFLVSILIGNFLVAGTPHLNLFNAYDWLVTPPDRPCGLWQIAVGFEGAVHAKSFQAAEDANGISHCFIKRADELQLYQDQQDFLAALKGPGFESALARLSQQFNIDDDNGTEGLFIPRGKFEFNNVLFSAYRYLPYGFIFQLNMQILSYRLKDVSWEPAPGNSDASFDSQVISNDFISAIESIGDINLRGWRRAGIGDIAALIRWGKHFPQARPLLHNVYLGFRTGLTIPTGKETDPDLLLGLPLGNDAGAGILIAGTLEMLLCNYYLFGIDAELLHLFGNTRIRRVKTDMAQTDLIFLNKACAFIEPGFTQHFSLYFKNYFKYGVYFMAAYQYTKQQESKLYFTTDQFDPSVANTAENLQSWTTHSAIFSLTWDFYNNNDCRSWSPYFSLLVKWGFNGSRAILADTITALFTVTF
jgi:hypothetical protein